MFRFVPNTNTRIPAEKRRSARGGPRSVGQIPRTGDEPIDCGQKNARQRVRARDAQREQFPPFAGRARPPCADSSHRPRAHTKTILDGLAPVVDGPVQPDLLGIHEQCAALSATIPMPRADCSPKRDGRPGPDGIRRKHGRALAFTLMTQAGYAIRENIAQAIERQLREVGVDVRVQLGMAPRSAPSGSKGDSRRCCPGGRCRPTRS